MKDKKIFDAWNQAEPSAAADARMLDAILDCNQSKTRKVYPMRKTYKRLIPLAACLMLTIAGAIAIPRFAAQPPVAPPTQAIKTAPPSQAAQEEIQQIDLPVMLAGQEVKWENVPVKDTDAEPANPQVESIWFVNMLGNGMELNFGSNDTKVVGTLSDGRKITAAIEEVSRSPKAAEKDAVSIHFEVSAPDVEQTIEVGSTIMEFSYMDETGTIGYRCYIEAIE